ncbi:hypothetical protein ACIPSE_32505 [Streptomyces sp. NPDC090106]|uniref:hypothetical protein n=1 Tax=Streptomyces sp. NPDC090106 TaxID=3365946 RepID=UPI0037F70985
MPTYVIDWQAFNEVIEQLGILQQEIDSLNTEFTSGNSSALSEWTSEAKDAFETRRVDWTNAATAMHGQAAAVQKAADDCREEYQAARAYGVRLWSK